MPSSPVPSEQEQKALAALKPLMLKDLRIQARQRGVQPAGSIEDLRNRLAEHMVSSNNYDLYNEVGQVVASAGAIIADVQHTNNNYNRPQGQNVGNFMTDRSSSRVLAPPGGGSHIAFGDGSDAQANSCPPKQQQQPPMRQAGAQESQPSQFSVNPSTNNYSRPGGAQNVGNFITDRASSRVTKPPGGASQVLLG